MIFLYKGELKKIQTFHATCTDTHWKYNFGIRAKSMVNLILRLYTEYWVTNASMYRYNSMY